MEPWDPSHQTGTQLLEETDKKNEPMWYVVLHDDDLHTYQYVVEMLTAIFKMTENKAYTHACEVDAAGHTIVAQLPRGRAEEKRDAIMAYGGDQLMETNVSMRASIEPCDN